MLEAEDKSFITSNAAEGAGRSAWVLGLGASGRAAAQYLNDHGWRVHAFDTREAPAGLDAFCKAVPGCEMTLGGFPETTAPGVELVVMSPGVSPYFGAAASVCASARKAGIPIVGEIELFAQELAYLKRTQGYAPKVIGITGTNGKTTTTTLTTKMAAAAGLYAVAAGNIGPNAVAELSKAEAAGALPDIWVLELSSFQLETTHTLNCTSAALLNITEDHLDWHGSIEAYAHAKGRIFAPDTVRVVNREDPLVMAELEKVDDREHSAARCFTFGATKPQKEGELGLMMAAHASQGYWLGLRDQMEVDVLFLPEFELLIRGRHNAMNALAALGLITGAGIETRPAIGVLRTYRGEPHRVELVRTIEGRDFIDDSKGTNVGAVAAAVCGLAAQGRRILILMGGDGKGQDFTPLAKELKGRVAFAALIGRDAAKIREAVSPAGVATETFKTLEAAEDWLWEKSRPGDQILLSPACASWDMFRDYAERSERFKAEAAKIADHVVPKADEAVQG